MAKLHRPKTAPIEDVPVITQDELTAGLGGAGGGDTSYSGS